jgi:D-alanyl-D-alanine carboxypeptidase
MTYAVVSGLADAGRLRLDDLAVRHVEAGTLDGIPYGNTITVAQLLEHRSGLHNFNNAAGNDFFTDLFANPRRGSRTWGAADLLAYAAKPSNPPAGEPGAQRHYSSTGYIVLQAVIEHLERQPFSGAFKRYLFDPFAMTRAGVEGADLTADDMAPSYARPATGERGGSTPFGTRPAIRADGLVNVSSGLRYYNAWAQAAGAAAATADDLMRFMDAVKAGRVAVLADQRAQFSAAALKPGASFSWNGGSWGIQASIVYEPNSDVTVVVLANGSNAGDSSLDLARRLLAAARRTP